MECSKETISTYLSEDKTLQQIRDLTGLTVRGLKKIMKEYGLKARKNKGLNLVGKKFGLLNVLSFDHFSDHGKKYLCECDCGKRVIVRGSSLNKGRSKSCGAACPVKWKNGHPTKGILDKQKALSRIGEKHSRLKIIDIKEVLINERPRKFLYVCECDCGQITLKNYNHLKNGFVKSCGCYIKDPTTRIGRLYGLKNASSKHGWYFMQDGKRVKCRSGYEVLFANFLITNGISFQYEPQLFELDENTRYIPDFKIGETYFEIKGLLKEESVSKMEIFSKENKLEILFWKDLVKFAKLPFKSYSTFMRRAKAINMPAKEYFAKMIYQQGQYCGGEK